MLRHMLKLGKHVWFPSVPPNWVRIAVKSIARSQYPRGRNQVLYPFPGLDRLYAKVEPCDSEQQRLEREEEYLRHKDDDKDNEEASRLYDHLLNLTPIYPDSINALASAVFIEEGKSFDVVSWLSTRVGNDDNNNKCYNNYLVRKNGEIVRVESLRGKNIVVCCLKIPVTRGSFEANIMGTLPYSCSIVNYEFVIVPRMKIEVDDDEDEDAFNHFVSGLPSSSLIVPFSHTLRRDFLCKTLNLVFSPKYLIVDENQNVLFHKPQNSTVDVSNFHPCVDDTGTSWWKSHTQLDDILNCKPSDFVYNFSNPEGCKASISELKEKVVGLYLCADGRFIQPLNLIYQECKARNLEFEIVLVLIPYKSPVVSKPQLFKEAIDQVLQQMNVTNWWVSPFDYFASFRLWQVGSGCRDDQLIIIGPHGKFVEPYGKEIITIFGIDYYPFAREHLVDVELETYRELTLESVMVQGSFDRLFFTTHDTSVDETLGEVPWKEALEGKTVLLYVDNLGSMDVNLYFPLLKWYCYLKRTNCHPDFEVVFIDLDGYDIISNGVTLMPWLFYSCSVEQEIFMKRKLRKGRHALIAAFGKDGKLFSLNPQALLDSYGPNDLPSYSNLRNDAVEQIRACISDDRVAYGIA